MKIKVFILTIFFLSSSFGQNSVLDSYIEIGLKNNLALQNKEYSLQQSLTGLQKARGMFLPSLDIKSRYTRADGGREIDILVGDLVNPMQHALNSLNPNFGFPANIQNESIPFLRKEEHDTKVSLVQPIIQPALFYNYSINKNLVQIQKLEKNIYTRKLIANIKIAYINILKTKEVLKIYESSSELLKENLRVNERLFKNDKITIDYVHRAKAELLEIEKEVVRAEKNYDLAKSYLNFLLNRPLESEIEEEDYSIKENLIFQQMEYESFAIENREELKQLKVLMEIAEDQQGIANASYYPGLSLAVDYGFQGEKYKFSSDKDYWMTSLVFNWNIFNGFKDNAESEKAEIEVKKNEIKLVELKNKIRLQIREAYKNLIVTKKMIESSKEQLKSSKTNFKIVNKKYREGMVNQIEYLDAQNKLTQSQISKLLSEYEYYENYIKFEQLAAKIDIEKFNNSKGAK